MIEIINPGALATVQDLGRLGYGAWGLSVAGAADRGSHRLANRLVGNDESDATIEITLGGFSAIFRQRALVAFTGAPCSVVVDGSESAMNCAMWINDGALLMVGFPSDGIRTYMAIRGGINVAAVLGSRSTDLNAEIGPPPLAIGSTLPIGTTTKPLPPVDWAPVALFPTNVTLSGVFGPRDQLFTADALDVLNKSQYVVDARSDRVGIRLRGRVLERTESSERYSEGVIAGAIEVPPDGQPILFLVDHPSTSGYPVIAVIDDESLDRAARLRPGQFVQFRLRPAPPAL